MLLNCHNWILLCWPFRILFTSRITSYNVCYTKLLRERTQAEEERNQAVAETRDFNEQLINHQKKEREAAHRASEQESDQLAFYNEMEREERRAQMEQLREADSEYNRRIDKIHQHEDAQKAREHETGSNLKTISDNVQRKMSEGDHDDHDYQDA